MRILCVCEEGNNRSVTLAQRLRYHNHETIAVGTNRHGSSTLLMLSGWADMIISVDNRTRLYLENNLGIPSQLWDIGPDRYPRPFNRELMRICDDLIKKFHQTPNTRSSQHATDRSSTGPDRGPHRSAVSFGDDSREGAAVSQPGAPHPFAAGGDATRPDPYPHSSDPPISAPGPAGSGSPDSHAVPVRDEHLHQ